MYYQTKFIIPGFDNITANVCTFSKMSVKHKKQEICNNTTSRNTITNTTSRHTITNTKRKLLINI